MRKRMGWKKVCVFLALCAAGAIGLPGQTFTVLANFKPDPHGSPGGDFLQATDGNFYGYTCATCKNVDRPPDYGTVFRITPSGAVTTVYTFCTLAGCQDGYVPTGALIQGTDGNFYGGTTYGGANGHGTFFQLTLEGVLTTLYNFCSLPNCADGHGVNALVQGTDGDFYCVTSSETFVKITVSGTLTTLHHFTRAEGNGLTSLIEGTDGSFYGVARYGGTSTSAGGTIFKVTSGGKETTLYNFCATDCADGYLPYSVVQGTDGNFYGSTTRGGGAAFPGGYGTAFQMTPSGVLTTLHTFCQAACTDGEAPGPLVEATDGNFYGDAGISLEEGSALDGLTIFQVTPGGAFTTLYTTSSSAGISGVNGMVQGTDGSFYGITLEAAFQFSTGLGPFVKTLPTAGKIGSAVTILGTDLTGATGVAFNGKSVAFTVVSATEISTTVPHGATTGTVEVTAPGGTLSGFPPFEVLR